MVNYTSVSGGLDYFNVYFRYTIGEIVAIVYSATIYCFGNEYGSVPMLVSMFKFVHVVNITLYYRVIMVMWRTKFISEWNMTLIFLAVGAGEGCCQGYLWEKTELDVVAMKLAMSRYFVLSEFALNLVL